MLYFKLPVNHKVSLVKPEINMSNEFFNLVQKNSEHLAEFLDFISLTKEVKDSENFIKRSISQEAQGKENVFFITDNDKIIGCIDLHNIDMTHKKAEIGYWLDKDYTRNNITSDCVNKICQLAFDKLKLNKLIILAEETNMASNLVAKKVGFYLDGIEREDLFRQNKFVTMNKYSLLKSDFKTK
ncbi:GNAT family N-acetyltransferase [Vagococcus teuberi]|uniref:N-acetyltransferase domain-containing protein n=1 Tax=Vagococcus teuberi TaxID=519472 RepID=A0A1J0A5E4_9ENTE|nr:GNAT family protein [Vagococcus teuberi]APB31157.1 hypothetical protein BHY08_04525 [Vagococcus teuberi]